VPGKNVDELRTEVLARFDKRVLRLEDLLVRYMRLIDHQLTGLTNECMGGFGYKAEASDPKLLQKIKDLGAAFNSATDSKVRLDKTMKDREKDMTEKDEEEAVRTWIRSRDNRVRGNFLYFEVQWHNEAKTGKASAKTLTGPELEPEGDE
jgi:hypothetical protein